MGYNIVIYLLNVSTVCLLEVAEFFYHFCFSSPNSRVARLMAKASLSSQTRAADQVHIIKDCQKSSISRSVEWLNACRYTPWIRLKANKVGSSNQKSGQPREKWKSSCCHSKSTDQCKFIVSVSFWCKTAGLACSVSKSKSLDPVGKCYSHLEEPRRSLGAGRHECKHSGVDIEEDSQQ